MLPNSKFVASEVTVRKEIVFGDNSASILKRIHTSKERVPLIAMTILLLV